MAHQTSKSSTKQSIPRSIGRLMDADFSLVIFFLVGQSPFRGLTRWSQIKKRMQSRTSLEFRAPTASSSAPQTVRHTLRLHPTDFAIGDFRSLHAGCCRDSRLEHLSQEWDSCLQTSTLAGFLQVSLPG